MKSNCILFVTPLLKAQNDKICQKFGREHGPFGPRGYAYGSGWKKTEVGALVTSGKTPTTEIEV